MGRCLAWSLASCGSPNPRGKGAGPTESPNAPQGCHTLLSLLSGLSSFPLMTSFAIWPTLVKHRYLKIVTIQTRHEAEL
ncbi:rCG20411 [Rattus norvegicus]|uniref:RCG20411 n=1 Tax=Rattus norvegicus TaxID=10116 RepID=A6JGT6_RAT|nr:rCG20411 [Rattus norvegicus]